MTLFNASVTIWFAYQIAPIQALYDYDMPKVKFTLQANVEAQNAPSNIGSENYYQFTIGDRKKMSSEIDQDFWGNVHGISLTVAWLILENIALWALYFKHVPNAVYVHIFCMSAAALIMTFAPMIQLVINGPQIIVASVYHELMGFVLFVLLPVMLISGATTKVLKTQSLADPRFVYLANKVHSAMGWVYILAIKVVLLTGWYGTNQTTNILFGVILFVSVVSYSGYLYLKFFSKKMGSGGQPSKETSHQLRAIKSSKDLRIYSNNYFIFANRIYSLNPLLATHPGGWKIIESARGRQVDRFLYGVDPIEAYDVPRVSHSLRSISLAGPPIATLQLPPTYKPIYQLNKARVISATCHDPPMRIHTIYLALEGEPVFTGYSALTQIGQYYSLTMNGSISRLYTAVNFLQPANVGFMKRVAGGKLKMKLKRVESAKGGVMQPLQSLNEELSYAEKETSNVLPLLIKKYNDGAFTSPFLSGLAKQKKEASLQISQARGLGLALDALPSTHILILAGGTGLYPYSDLVDLLFKAKLAKQHPQLRTQIYSTDPLLQDQPFDRLSLSVYFSTNQVSQLHPITLYQLNQLSTQSNFKAYAYLKSPMPQFTQMYGNISVVKQRFQDIVQTCYAKQPGTYTYICGPVRFTRALAKCLEGLAVPGDSYRIL